MPHHDDPCKVKTVADIPNLTAYKQTLHVKYEGLCHANTVWGPHHKLMTNAEKMAHAEYGMWHLLMAKLMDINEYNGCVERAYYSLNFAEETKNTIGCYSHDMNFDVHYPTDSVRPVI